MTQSRKSLLAHVVAFPSALLLSTALAFSLGPGHGPAVDVQLSDTMFVVAHVHFGLILALCVAAISIVAQRWGRLNWAIFASWGLLLVHVVTGALLNRQARSLSPSEANVYLWLTPLDPAPGILYLGSVPGVLLALATGLVLSLRTSRGQR